MTSETNSPYVDFLLEMEFRLQQDLNMVRRKLEAELGETVTRHLVAVPDLPTEPDGA